MPFTMVLFCKVCHLCKNTAGKRLNVNKIRICSQKAVFCDAKHGLLRCHWRPFARRKAANGTSNLELPNIYPSPPEGREFNYHCFIGAHKANQAHWAHPDYRPNKPNEPD